MSDQSKFATVSVDLEAAAKKEISDVLADKKYDPNEAATWLSTISREVLNWLQNHIPEYRFIVNCTLSQKVGGLHTTSACYWDGKTDGSRIVRWDNEEMHCIVIVYGISLS